MKEHEARLTATGIIWIAFSVVMLGVLAVSDHVSSADFMILAFMFTVAALAGTNMIWRRPKDSIVQIESSEKSKRRSRVETMLDSMSDDELDELRDRLASDGEAMSLDELLVERERRQR